MTIHEVLYTINIREKFGEMGHSEERNKYSLSPLSYIAMGCAK